MGERSVVRTRAERDTRRLRAKREPNDLAGQHWQAEDSLQAILSVDAFPARVAVSMRILYAEAVLKGPVPWLLVVVALVILGWVLWKRTRPSRTYVIGEQMAQAQRAEQARLSSSKAGPSPLPANLHYDSWLGDLDLSDPARRPLDDELSALCRRFAMSDLTSRSQLRDSASMDDFYTLLSFSRRSAVFAMRDRKTEHIIDGLMAVAMIDQNRIDFRDALQALSLLHHAARVIGANVDELFGKAASVAEPGMSELILAFLKRSEDQRDIRKSWGATVVETKGGPGFVGWGFQSYRPTYPLDQIGLALAQLVKRDKYGRASVTLANDLPAVWLSSVDDDALKRALTSIRGAATVNADLRPQESLDYQHQSLTIFLAELDDESAAESLFRLSQEKQTLPKNFAMVGAKEGRLFCLAVERSIMAGKPAFESRASMQRFSTGIAEVLKGHFQE